MAVELAPLLAAAEQALVVVAEPARETLSVSGSDGKRWLDGLVSGSLESVGPERGAYALLLTKQGKIQSDLDVIAADSGLLLGVAAGRGAALAAMLDGYLVMEDAEIRELDEIHWWRLVGARAAEVARALSARGHGALDWLGLGGAALAVPAAESNALLERALELGGHGARSATREEWDALRTSCALPAFGIDYGLEDNPHEAALDRLAVSWTKGCYLGQEVVCMQDMRGKLKRRLLAVRAVGTELAPGDEVLALGEGRAVGRITSAVRVEDATLAFARVQAPFFEAGQLAAGGVELSLIERRVA